MHRATHASHSVHRLGATHSSVAFSLRISSHIRSLPSRRALAPPVLLSHATVVLTGPDVIFGFGEGLEFRNRRRRVAVCYTLRSIAGVFMHICSRAALRM